MNDDRRFGGREYHAFYVINMEEIWLSVAPLPLFPTFIIPSPFHHLPLFELAAGNAVSILYSPKDASRLVVVRQ
jgi:hypothetical protein